MCIRDRNSAVLAELDAEAAALEQARAEAETAAQQAADAKAALDAQQAALQATQCELETALLDANSALTAQQAAAQAQAAVTDAAKKAYEDALSLIHISTEYVERWLSWSKAHDWKSCRAPKALKGSNPFLSAYEPPS